MKTMIFFFSFSVVAIGPCNVFADDDPIGDLLKKLDREPKLLGEPTPANNCQRLASNYRKKLKELKENKDPGEDLTLKAKVEEAKNILLENCATS